MTKPTGGSFSKLKLIKSYLRSTMGDSGLSLISIERALEENMDFDKIIERLTYAKKKKDKTLKNYSNCIEEVL